GRLLATRVLEEDDMSVQVTDDLARSPLWRAGATMLRLVVRTGQMLQAIQDRAQERYKLLELDDRMLRDIGLTRADVVRALSRPLWNVHHLRNEHEQSYYRIPEPTGVKS